MKKIFLFTLIFFVAQSLRAQNGNNTYPWPLNQNIGVGTQSPEATFHIKSVSGNYAYGLKIEGYSGFSGGMRLQNNTTGTGKTYSIYSSSDGDFILGDENLQKVKMAIWPVGGIAFNDDVAVGYVDANEPVGSRLLTVNGVVRARTYFQSTNGSEDWGTYHFSLNDPANGPRFVIGLQGIEAADGSGSDFRIWRYDNTGTYVDQAFSINRKTGNVGIGTTVTGTNKLAVEGTISARKVKVTAANPFPDYVFANGYKLPTLEEIESYIKTNHRLPEMPSADQVEKDGLDVGNNQILLVKKLEELTLYVIEQNKKLEEKDKRIDSMLKEMQVMNQKIEKLEKAAKK